MDMTKDIGAGAYKVPYRWRPMHSTFRNADTHLLYLHHMQKYNILELTEKELPELQ